MYEAITTLWSRKRQSFIISCNKMIFFCICNVFMPVDMYKYGQNCDYIFTKYSSYTNDAR